MDSPSDNGGILDDDQFEMPRTLLVTETDGGGIECEDISDTLTDNDRIAILVKALLLEAGPTLVDVLCAMDDEAEQDDDDED